MGSLIHLLMSGAICLLLAGTAHARGGPPDKPSGGAKPLNVIIMVGDGMGPVQVEAGRRFAPGGELVMERLDPKPGYAGTDDVFGGITDSAASGTALATGQKTYYGAISVDVDGNPLETAFERAEAAGKSTGILSSVFLADATPGVWAAHAPYRGDYTAIATQEAASGVEVLLGSGELNFLPIGANGTGGVNLVEQMLADGYQLVKTAEDLAAAQAPNDKLLGFWGGYAMPYVLDRQQNGAIDAPTLAQMTEKAIEVLSRDRDGFFLVVEGGAIDWVAHNRDFAGTVAEVLAFDEAVAVAFDFAARDGNTILVVTADHETGGLQLGDAIDEAFVSGITATTDYMWGLIARDDVTVEGALATYAGIDALTPEEKARIDADGEMGISDVVSARAGVSWGWSGRDDGEHTRTKVPVFAFGPGTEGRLEGTDLENTDVGKLLLEAAAR